MFKVDVAQGLLEQGYDVLRVSETGQERADDQQILQKAITESRILITLDEHFGDWVILPLRQHPGVIRIKVHPTLRKRIESVTALPSDTCSRTISRSSCDPLRKAGKVDPYQIINQPNQTNLSRLSRSERVRGEM